MSMAIQAARTEQSTGALSRPQLTDKSIGLVIAALLPALFWTLLVAGIGHAIGQAPSLATLMLIGSSIAAFLALVVGSIIAR